MGRRSRRRRAAGAQAAELEPLVAEYDGLTLRGTLSPASRRAYAELPEGVREDAWQRRVAFLWEKLAVRWEVEGVPYEGPRELLGRFRAASPEERAVVRRALRAHLAEFFPELEAP